MSIQSLIKDIIGVSGYTIVKKTANFYDQDGLASIHNHDFMLDRAFSKAYERGKRASGKDHRWHWRVHVGLWAAYSASRLKGDFVECGVNWGFLSSAIMDYLDWDSLNRTFYLLDTFQGLDRRYTSDEDVKSGALDKNEAALKSGFYTGDVDDVRKNFSQWNNVKIIQGAVPETLSSIQSAQIAYLHLDMNCSPPEVAAFNLLWDRLTPGALILLDDYAYYGYEPQKDPMDAAVANKGLKVLSLPTGQGLVIKPV